MKIVILVLSLLYCLPVCTHAQSLGITTQRPQSSSSTLSLNPQKPEEQKPEWYDKIVAEFYGYQWFTDGRFITRQLWDDEDEDGDPWDDDSDDNSDGGSGTTFGYSDLKYHTDSNLYIIGGETGYKFDLPFLRRITGSYEVSQGSSNRMHGTDADPEFSDPEFNNFIKMLSFQLHSGRDSAKYIRTSFFVRPLEGKITKDITGYFDLVGEWIRYKDRVSIDQITDVIPGDDGTFSAETRSKIRYEGPGVGFRGGLGFFEMFKLDVRFTYYPSMSVRESDQWDADGSRLFTYFGRDESGLAARFTFGFVPPVKFIKDRKRLEFEFGYQYMQFEQNGGHGRMFNLRDGSSAPFIKWDRAVSYRDGFFVGGTLRW